MSQSVNVYPDGAIFWVENLLLNTWGITDYTESSGMTIVAGNVSNGKVNLPFTKSTPDTTRGCIGTLEAVDMQGYSSLKGLGTSNATNTTSLIVVSQKEEYNTHIEAQSANATTEGIIFNVDISAVNSGYIAMRSGATSNVGLSQIWRE